MAETELHKLGRQQQQGRKGMDGVVKTWATTEMESDVLGWSLKGKERTKFRKHFLVKYLKDLSKMLRQ